LEHRVRDIQAHPHAPTIPRFGGQKPPVAAVEAGAIAGISLDGPAIEARPVRRRPSRGSGAIGAKLAGKTRWAPPPVGNPIKVHHNRRCGEHLRYCLRCAILTPMGSGAGGGGGAVRGSPRRREGGRLGAGGGRLAFPKRAADAVAMHHRDSRERPCACQRKLWVRVPCGEPNLNRWTSGHLIDFITGVSDVSSDLAPFGSDPGVDSNSFVRPASPKNESALADYACQLPSGWPSARNRRDRPGIVL
jgi:hypothetical protein